MSNGTSCGTRASWPYWLLLLTPLASIYDYDSNSCRLLVTGLAGVWILGAAALFVLRGAPAWRLDAWTLAALAWILILIFQATRSRNPLAAASALTLHLVGITAALILRNDPGLRTRIATGFPPLVFALGIVIGSAGIAEFLGFAPRPFLGPYVGTPGSLFVHGNYGGTFAALLLPLAVIHSVGGRGLWRRVFGFTAVGLLGAYLLISRSRGALIGTAAAAAVFLLLRQLRRSRNEDLPLPPAFVMPLAALFAGFLAAVLLMPAERRADWVAHVGRTYTFNVRIELWEATLSLWREHPLLGVGIGNFAGDIHPSWMAVQTRSSARPWEVRALLPGDPHSIYLGALCESGLLGLAAAGAFIVIALGSFVRRWKAGEGADEAATALAWAGTVTVFLVTGLNNTLSEHPSHALFLFVGLGWLAGFGALEPGVPVLSARLLRTAAWGFLAAGVGAATVIHLTHFPARYARLKYWEDGAKEGGLLDRAAALHPWKPMDHLRTAGALLRSGLPGVAAVEFQRALRFEPLNINAWALLGEARQKAGLLVDARTAYSESARLAPDWPYPALRSAELELLLEKDADALATLERLCTRWTEWGEAYFLLGMARAGTGDANGALLELRRAAALGEPVRNRLRSGEFLRLMRPQFNEFLK